LFSLCFSFAFALLLALAPRNCQEPTKNLSTTCQEPAKNLPGTSAEHTNTSNETHELQLAFRKLTSPDTKKRALQQGAAVCTPHGVFNIYIYILKKKKTRPLVKGVLDQLTFFFIFSIL
jgi:hypothetical protein